MIRLEIESKTSSQPTLPVIEAMSGLSGCNSGQTFDGMSIESFDCRVRDRFVDKK